MFDLFCVCHTQLLLHLVFVQLDFCLTWCLFHLVLFLFSVVPLQICLILCLTHLIFIPRSVCPTSCFFYSVFLLHILFALISVCLLRCLSHFIFWFLFTQCLTPCVHPTQCLSNFLFFQFSNFPTGSLSAMIFVKINVCPT